MMEITGTLIYWYISIGLFVGLISRLIFRKDGLPTISSILMGALGSVSVGILSQIFQLGDNLIMGLIGAIGFLFIINIFRSQHAGPSMEIEHG